MMYALMPSPVFLEYNGIKIYSVYKNDEEAQGTRTYWYGLNEWCSDFGDFDPEYAFDIRDIDGYDNNISIEDNLKRMIDAGLLKNIE